MSRSHRHQRLYGAVRTAFCLGTTLLLLAGGAAYFLSGTPGGGAGVSDRDGPPGQQESGGVWGAGGSRDGSAGTAGMDATHSTDAEGDSRTAFGREDVLAGPDGVSPAGGDGSSRFADIIVSAGAEADAVLRSLGAGAGGRLAGGRLYDGATGQGLAGARILATAFHGTEDLRTAGTPARDQVALDVGSEGTFEIPMFDPEDPRLLVHLQIDHPDYLPTVTVLRRRETLAAEWQRKEIPLRRGLTSRVQIVANQKPLARVPVQVTSMYSSHALLEKEAVSVAFPGSGRLITPGEPRIFYTDTSGYLRLPDSDYPYLLELLHPVYRLYWRDPDLDQEYEGRIRYRTPDSGAGRISALADEAYTFTLVDADGTPIGNSEAEISWDARTVRALTDDAGRLTVGLEPPVLIPPKPNATVTLLTPAYFKRGAVAKFPDEQSRVVVPWRPARRLVFRTMNQEEEPQPVPPEGVRLMSSGLTLTRRSSSGRVEFQGDVPPEGELVEIRLRGYLPRDVRIPPMVSQLEGVDGSDVVDMSDAVDLGDVSFDRGLSAEIVLEGVHRSLLSEATLMVSPVDRPDQVQRYPLRGTGRVKVSGLEVGTYDLGVEGPYLRRYSQTFEASAKAPEEPITAALHRSEEESIVVRGRVVGVDASEMTRLTVIERYSLRGIDEPVLTEVYPPAPDGTFGSVRRLRGVEAVHLSVISRGENAVDARVSRRDQETILEVGALRLLLRPSAVIKFYTEELELVTPPLNVTLEGSDGREVNARLRRRLSGRFNDHFLYLYIDNLSIGVYQLQWAVGDGGKESVDFEVTGRETEVRVKRSALPVERLAVRVVDSAGLPIADSSVPQEDLPTSCPAFPKNVEFEAGVHTMTIKTRERNRFDVTAEGYIPARVEVEPGGVVPTEITLYRPVSAEATIVDSEGQGVSGFVRVSWKPESPTSIRYGKPLVVEVRRGRFASGGFPPLPLRFTFRLVGSVASTTRAFSLPENGDLHDLGVLRVAETRSMGGVVLLPDGEPAPGATVAIVDHADAWRLPLRDPRDTLKIRYKASTDVQGGFVLEELPLDLADDQVLVAFLDGYGDAYEYPLETELDSHELRLDQAAGLELNVGYENGVERDEYRFALYYQADPGDPSTRFELGEIPPRLSGLNEFPAVEPGVYRVAWELRDDFEPIPPIYEEVLVEPGRVTSLTLRLRGRELRGEALWNTRPVRSGWILLTNNPGAGVSTRAGKITDGEFRVIDPPSGGTVFGAIIPDGTPQVMQNIARGEALPVPVDGYREALRDGFLRFDYEAVTLRLRFTDKFLADHPGAYLSFDHYEWKRGRLVPYRDRERITSRRVLFHLLQPIKHRFTVLSKNGRPILNHSVQLTTVLFTGFGDAQPIFNANVLVK